MSNWTAITSPGAAGAPQLNKTNSSQNQHSPPGPPYPPTTALLGGVPTPSIDDPISAILMVLFLVAAALHMITFQKNKSHGHLFVFSAMMFAFSLIRAVALLMRIVWASMPRNVQVALAANILTMAGTVIVFIVNLFFAQRIIRGSHPKFGWSTRARFIFRFLVAAVVASLLMVIAVTISSFYTLDPSVIASDRAAQLFAATFLAVLAFIPIPAVIIAIMTPRRFSLEKFGEGSWRAKLILVLFTSTLLSLGAWFRVGTNYVPRPQNDPAWYLGRAPYYVFNYVLDLIVTYTYLAFAFHRRFHIPNGAKGPGSYMDEKHHATGGETPYISSLNFSKSALSLKKPKPVAATTSRPRSEVTLRGFDDGRADSPPPFFGLGTSSMPRLPSTMNGEYDNVDLAMMTPTFAHFSSARGYPNRESTYPSIGGETVVGSVGGELHGNLEDMLDKIGSTPARNSVRLSQWGYQAYADAGPGSSGGSYKFVPGKHEQQSIASSGRRRRVKRLSLNESVSGSSCASPTSPRRNSIGILGTATTAHIRSVPAGSASASHSESSQPGSYVGRSRNRPRSSSHSSGLTGSYVGSHPDHRYSRTRAGSRGRSRAGSRARSQPQIRRNSELGGQQPASTLMTAAGGSMTPRCSSLRTTSNAYDTPGDSRSNSLPRPGSPYGDSSRPNSGSPNSGMWPLVPGYNSSIPVRPPPSVLDARRFSRGGDLDARSETFHSIQSSSSEEFRRRSRRDFSRSRGSPSGLGDRNRSVSIDRMASMRTAPSRRRSSSASVYSYSHPLQPQQQQQQ